MKRRRLLFVGVIAATGLAWTGLAGTAAYGNSDEPWDGGYSDTLIRDTLILPDEPADPSDLGITNDPQTPREIETLTRALALNDGGNSVVNTAWSEDKRSLIVYASGDLRAIQGLIEKSGATELVSVVQTEYSPEELEAGKDALFSNAATLSTGERLFAVMPTVDGSGLIATYEEPADGEARRAPVPDLRQSSGGLPVQVEFGPVPEAASRASDSAPFKAGAFMRKSNGGCTTAFKIGHISSGVQSLITAHHCSPDNGVSWHQGVYASTPMTSTNYLGLSTGQAPGGSDIGRLGGPSNSLAAWVYGAGPSSNSGYPTIGWTNPAVGAVICYSGAYSGAVCQNEVTNSGLSVCYINDPGSPCYDDLVRTAQTSGIPAAGNGDSGGPAFVLTAQGAYAAGVISGIQNGSITCTGIAGADPGRKCSNVVLYAPMSNFFWNNTGWGIYTSAPIGG